MPHTPESIAFMAKNLAAAYEEAPNDGADTYKRMMGQYVLGPELKARALAYQMAAADDYFEATGQWPPGWRATK